MSRSGAWRDRHRRWRGLLLALAVVMPVVLVSCADPAPGPVVLHATADQAFVTPDGEPVVLNGLNISPIWNQRGRTWDQGVYDKIAEKGFNSVRFVLHWADFEPERGRFDQASLATLDTAIARAKAAGLYVVLDPIHLFGDGGTAWVPGWAVTGDSVTTISTNAHGYLVVLAQRYRDEPAVAAYDLVNEPHRWPIDQNGVLRMYDGLIATVRPVDPRKIVLIEPSFGDSSIAAGCADLGTLHQRDNVVFSLHYYFAGRDDDGFDGCAQAGAYGHDGATGYDASDAGAIRRHLASYTDVLAQQGIPLFIGEFALGDRAPGRDAWLAEVLRLFDGAGLGRSWWEYRTTGAGNFSATDEDGRWRPFVDKLVAPPSVPGAPARTPPFVRGPGTVTLMAAGDFTSCQGPESCQKSATARVRDVMAADNPDAILAIGDFQYENIDGIRNGFDLLFGPKPAGLWPRTYPTGGPGHDVKGCRDERYQDYWGRDPTRGYSFDLGEWHLISLPSAVFRYDCSPATVTAWLDRDLQANTKRCTLAFWQDPYWTRPTEVHNRESELRPWIDVLYAHGADVIVQASNHNYQRFAQQRPDDQLDPERGIRAFVVGTGGASLYRFTGDAPNVEVSRDNTWGALELTLRPDGYDWRFVPVPGARFTDSGSGGCH